MIDDYIFLKKAFECHAELKFNPGVACGLRRIIKLEFEEKPQSVEDAQRETILTFSRFATGSYNPGYVVLENIYDETGKRYYNYDWAEL